MELRWILTPTVLLSSLLIGVMLTLAHAMQSDSRLPSTPTRGRHHHSGRKWPVSPWDSAAGEMALREFRYPAALSHESSFLPTGSRCCRVGDTTARRRQGCTLAAHATARARTMQNAELRRMYGQREQSVSDRALTRDLADKVSDCYNSPFSKHFKKCCFHRTLFVKEMNQCRRLKKGTERKQCRREVRKKYP